MQRKGSTIRSSNIPDSVCKECEMGSCASMRFTHYLLGMLLFDTIDSNGVKVSSIAIATPSKYVKEYLKYELQGVIYCPLEQV